MSDCRAKVRRDMSDLARQSDMSRLTLARQSDMPRLTLAQQSDMTKVRRGMSVKHNKNK
jgi:hypothetical protein